MIPDFVEMEMFWSRHLKLPLLLGNTVGDVLRAQLFKYIDHCCVKYLILWGECGT